jgi:adenylylsulfate kinase
MSNLTYHPQSISLAEREAQNGHKSAVLWFTGLSGSGKSTLAMALQEVLFKLNCQVTTLDGDNVRHGLNDGLGFTRDDRVENLRRVAEVSKLFADSGFIVLTSFISPYKEERARAKSIISPLNFFEIYVDVDLETAESRDPKGLYKKARQGEITNFTGIDSPYEIPEIPDLKIDNNGQDVQRGVEQILTFLKQQQIIS